MSSTNRGWSTSKGTWSGDAVDNSKVLYQQQHVLSPIVWSKKQTMKAGTASGYKTRLMKVDDPLLVEKHIL